MARRKNGVLIKGLILAPYLIILYLLQSTVFTHLQLMGTKPLLLPVAAAGIAFFCGRVEGGVFGLLAGMLMDLSYNQLTVQFTLLMTFLGILVGLLSDTVLAQGFPSYLLSCALELALVSGYQILSQWVLGNAPMALTAPVALRQSLYSLIFSLPLYYLSRFYFRVTRSGRTV